jgi:hypothetical protein
MSKNNIIITLIIITVISIIFIGYFVRQTLFTNKDLKILPTPITQITPPEQIDHNEFTCSQDSECTIGIQTSQCCPCPQAIPVNLIDKYNFEVYDENQDYSLDKGSVCQNVICKPCQLPLTPVCQKDRCTFSYENQFCGGISGIQCPNGYECQLEGNYPDASGKCIKIIPKFGDAQTEEECLQKGGDWRSWGLRDIEYCQIPSNDYEKDCVDGSECFFGKCISQDGNIPGKCQKYRNIFGCFAYVNNGVINSKICVD